MNSPLQRSCVYNKILTGRAINIWLRTGKDKSNYFPAYRSWLVSYLTRDHINNSTQTEQETREINSNMHHKVATPLPSDMHIIVKKINFRAQR